MATNLARRADGRFVAGRSAPRRAGGGAVVVVPGTAGRIARRVGTGAARAAMDERHTLVALGTAAALGYVEREDMDIPHIEALGKAGTVGLALWAIGKYSKSRTMQHAATGALSIAVYKLVAESDDEG